MASAADRFTRLQKVAVFLITLGEEKTRQVLEALDLASIENINGAMAELGPLSAAEKAAVMIEFADFFYQDKPLSEKLQEPPPAKQRPAAAQPSSKVPPPAAAATKTQPPADETSILHTLESLRQKVDPDKIDWGKAGYDFGEGFKGDGDKR